MGEVGYPPRSLRPKLTSLAKWCSLLDNRRGSNALLLGLKVQSTVAFIKLFRRINLVLNLKEMLSYPPVFLVDSGLESRESLDY